MEYNEPFAIRGEIIITYFNELPNVVPSSGSTGTEPPEKLSLNDPEAISMRVVQTAGRGVGSVGRC